MRQPSSPRAIATILGACLVATAWVTPVVAHAAPVDDPLLDDRGVVVDGRMPPPVKAKSWIVVDAATGDVLAAKNAHERRRPASTLKSLTAITLLPRLDLKDSYRVQWRDAHVTGSAVGIVPGSRYTVDELFYGLLLPSGNDAARALASANGGMRVTVRQMNEKARELGALDTTAANSSGLDARRQYSSAFDLAIFARAGLADPDFRRYVTTTSISFPAEEPRRANKKRKSYMIYNQNPLLLDGYRGVLGVKTGYTTQAGRTFVAAAERGGTTLIVALMGIVEPTDTAATRLFEWGWKHGESVAPVGSLDAPEQTVPLPEEPHEGPVATPSSTALASGAADDPESSSSGPSVVIWALAGVALILLGWRLQRR